MALTILVFPVPAYPLSIYTGLILLLLVNAPRCLETVVWSLVGINNRFLIIDSLILLLSILNILKWVSNTEIPYYISGVQIFIRHLSPDGYAGFFIGAAASILKIRTLKSNRKPIPASIASCGMNLS